MQASPDERFAGFGTGAVAWFEGLERSRAAVVREDADAERAAAVGTVQRAGSSSCGRRSGPRPAAYRAIIRADDGLGDARRGRVQILPRAAT